jgi:hypothetical protein
VQEEVDPLPLRLEWMDPADLRANPANWRTHPPGQRLALSAAMKEVGWAGALLYNEATGRLIDGHLRKEVAPGPVPVLVGSWTEEQERLILATLDPLAAAAEADGAALATLLASVRTEDEHLAALLAGLAEAPGPAVALPGGTGDDVADVYQGLPEFVQDDLTSKFKVIVHFEDEAALEDFGRLVGQPLGTGTTQAIWHPRKQSSFPREFVVEDDPGAADEP